MVWADRTGVVALSKIIDLCGPIYHPFFNMSRYLLNQCDVRLKLYRSTPNFCLMSNVDTPSYAVELLDVCLLVQKIKVNPAVLYGTAKLRRKLPPNIRIVKLSVVCRALPKELLASTGIQCFQAKNQPKSWLPSLRHLTVSGDYSKNPFNFQNCGISEICVYADGIPVGGAPVKLDFDKTTGRTIARAFTDLFRFANKWKTDSGNDMNENDFCSGNTLFVFQLEPFYDGQRSFINLVRTGSIRLSVQFTAPLSETMTCIVYSEAPGYFQINEQRDIITE